ncbi:hypothetical protein ACFXKD_27605 [Nocardiopsis aegyptia]|uniref:hypothetical protein n=1 Tax=Nocardiopsis aegyptia TaxID=220378 RepID=UPI00366EF6C9
MSDVVQPPERVALREEMEARREYLGITWQQVADASGGETTEETLRRVRTGTSRIQIKTRKAIEVGLQWKRGSVSSILSGGPPTPLEVRTPQVRVTDTDDGQTLWINVPDASPEMVPLRWDTVPGLEDMSEEDRKSLAQQVVGVMLHAASSFLEVEGRRRRAANG